MSVFNTIVVGDWLTDWLGFYAVSAIFQPRNGGLSLLKVLQTCMNSIIDCSNHVYKIPNSMHYLCCVVMISLKILKKIDYSKKEFVKYTRRK